VPPPNLVVPKEFNFGGSIASTIAKPEEGASKSSEAGAVVVETAEVEPGVVRFTATPKAFKTPTALRSARKSRRSHSGLCIVERGSNSEKRRKRRGLDPFGGFLDFSGIPMDPMSPLHTTIRDRLLKGENPDDILNDSKKLIDFDESITSEASTPPASILRNSIYVSRTNANAAVTETGKEGTTDAAAAQKEMTSSLSETSTDPPTAQHFRNLLTSETARLTALCETWESKVTSSAPSDEEVAGQIRTTIGQARLLMNKKGRFEQFSGLVESCANGTGEKKTTVMDLQGFWDMIYFQVENVDKNFEELTRLEANGWKRVTTMTAAAAKENARPKKPAAAAVKRKAAAPAAGGGASKGLRAMMAAKRKEMAAKAKDEDDSAEAEAAKRKKTPEVAAAARESRGSLLLRAAVGAVETDGADAEEAEKVFEGGFFSVRSPMARSPLQRITPANTPGGSIGNSSRRRSARKSNVASTSMILAASAAGKINFDEIGGGNF